MVEFSRARASESEKSRRDDVLDRLVTGVRKGRPVVPLVGAGISIESGVPSLSEVTRYLAKTKAFLRYRVYENRPPRDPQRPIFRRSGAARRDEMPPFRVQTREYLREFGWPDPNELNSSLWHWGWRTGYLPSNASDYQSFMDTLVNEEILESLGRIDKNFERNVREMIFLEDSFKEILGTDGSLKGIGPINKTFEAKLSELVRMTKAGTWRLPGSYWKILLTQLTRSSPDLVDTLFQRLARNHEPSTAHRHFAFLTPVLRLRLFLTINFDTLLEDALRIEGFRPTVYEVADGLSLPHPKLVQEGLSVVKLHGGAYGLLVGDRLDSPLDEETRSRFQAYLPEHLILLVMGIGGWDQRVLDMVELARERQGEVLWLHFEPEDPQPLRERFATGNHDWLHTARVQDPGAFLREVYSKFKLSHPSSSRPFQICDLRPVLIDFQRTRQEEAEVKFGDSRVIVFVDHEEDMGLGGAWRLARLVAEKSKTHLPVWIDMETKFTVEDVLVDLIQQLRHYDPGLPPEILVIERTAPRRPRSGEERARDDYRKVVRRFYAALARGRYVLAFNGVGSFGRLPTRHHRDDVFDEELQPARHDVNGGFELRDQPEDLLAFLGELLNGIDPGSGEAGGPADAELPESLGLLDSILAFSLDGPALPESRDALRELARVGFFHSGAEPHWTRGRFECLRERDFWVRNPALAVLVVIRRRRNIVGLHKWFSKYLPLPLRASLAEKPAEEAKKALKEAESPDAIEQELEKWESGGYLWRLEGGDYWMSRKLRNELYSYLKSLGMQDETSEEKVRALSLLAFVHQDLADYHHRDVYVGSQDVGSLLEELYHRIAALRYLRRLETVAEANFQMSDELTAWLRELARPVSRVNRGGDRAVLPEQGVWTGAIPITAANRMDRTSLAQRRFRWLRALREVIEQERDALLSRVPGLTLQGWVHAIDRDVEDIAVPGADMSESWRSALSKERDLLKKLLGDIWIEVLQDRMKSEQVLKIRERDLKEFGEAGGSVEQNWESVERRARLLSDLAQAQRRGPRDKQTRERCRFEAELEEHLNCALEAGGHSTQQPVHVRLLNLKVNHLRLKADQELWDQSPWEIKGKSYPDLVSQKEAADRALQHCEEALQILDAIREDSRTLRSYLYSLRGRALYLQSDYDNAYREFDLARAGCYETTPSERETLAVTLLRRAECLMVHADQELADWVLELVDGSIFQNQDVEWQRLLSSEGRRKCFASGAEVSGEVARALIGLSLANCSPEVLSIIEARVRTIDKHGRSLKDTLWTVRSRLAAVGEMLDRVEGLLESSRSNVEWWACLFQLRTQMAVERLLLLLSGDYASVSPGESRRETGSSTWESDDPWCSVRAWMKKREPSEREEFPADWNDLLRRVPDPLSIDGELRRRFIHRFQGTLRSGVMAVRQGLDILLPNDAGRDRDRLQNDTLLLRLLRAWTELMICGAYATEMSLRVHPEHTLDDNRREPIQDDEGPERWEQWRYLNWLAGLTTLLDKGDSEGGLRKWFLDRKWKIGPPSLASRARIMARMDLCLIDPDDESARGFPGGNALALLCKALDPGGQPKQLTARTLWL